MGSIEETPVEIIDSKPLEGEANSSITVLKAELRKFDANAEEVRLGIKVLAALNITDADSREHAYQITKAANRSLKLIDARRKGILAPLKFITDGINDHAKTFLSGPLEKAIRDADAKILTFDREQERLRIEKQKELDAERVRIMAAAAAETKRLEDEKNAGVAQATESFEAQQATESFEAQQAKINAMPPGILRIKAQCELNIAKAAAVGAVEKQAAAATQEASIDRSLALSDVRNAQEDLAAEKDKGKVLAWKWEVLDMTKVPEIYKTIAEKVVNEAVRGGARDIPGIRIYSEEKLRH